MICPNCGANLEDNVSFCINCGCAVSSGNSGYYGNNAGFNSNAGYSNNVGYNSNPSVTTVDFGNAGFNNNPAPGKKSKSPIIWIIIGVAVFAVIAVVAAVLLFGNNKKSGSDDVNNAVLSYISDIYGTSTSKNIKSTEKDGDSNYNVNYEIDQDCGFWTATGTVDMTVGKDGEKWAVVSADSNLKYVFDKNDNWYHIDASSEKEYLVKLVELNEDEVSLEYYEHTEDSSKTKHDIKTVDMKLDEEKQCFEFSFAGDWVIYADEIKYSSSSDEYTTLKPVVPENYSWYGEKEPEQTTAAQAKSPDKKVDTKQSVSSYPSIYSAKTLSGSELAASNVSSDRSFEAYRAIDGNSETCWCVNTDTVAGSGASIKFTLDSYSTVSGIKLINGNLYHTYDDIYKSNGQVCEFTLKFSDGSTQKFVADFDSGTASWQYFDLDYPVDTDYIIMTVDTGYTGAKYTTNVCLGEFDVY